MLTLFPPQQRSHDVLVDAVRKHGAALDSSGTGTGKTLKAVEAVRTLGLKPMVICPKAVIPSWKRTFEGQGVPYLDVLNYEKIRNGSTAWCYMEKHVSKKGKRRVVTFEWTLPPGTLLIFDECHRCSGVRTDNALLLVQATRQNIPRLMLSATAAEDPSEMRALGYALGLHRDTDFSIWAKKWGCSLNPWRQWTFPNKSRPKLTALHALIYPDRGHKVSREDMGDFFTTTSIIADPVSFDDNGEIQRLYTEMAPHLDQLATDSAKDKGDNPLTRILRARQHIELLKVPAIADMVKEIVGVEHRSAVVFLNFRQSMDAVADRLGDIPVAFIHGGQSASEREANIQAFQADDAHVMLAQMAAGGVGVSLHDINGVRPRTSLINPSYDAKHIDQALGRIDRAGAKSDTIQRILVAADTIEEEVAKAFRRKLTNMSILHKNLDEDLSSYNVTPQHMTPVEPIPAVPEEKPAHAKWSPSKLKYSELCPGYQAREGGVNPAAEMGTRIHEALEKFNLDMLTDNWERLIAERCLEAYQFIVERHWPDKRPMITHHEVRLDINLVDDLETFGTCDVLLISGDEGISIDWKTGKGAIDDASVNTQAQAYVLGAFQRHPELEKIHFYFVIPQRDEITTHTYRREDCERIKLRLTTIIRRAEQFLHVWDKRGGIPHDLFNPQPNLCEFCSNPLRCHAVTNKVFDIARKYGTDGLEVPAKVHGSETDDPQDIAKLLLLVPVIEKWIEGVKARAKQMAFEEGAEIPGFEAKERAGKRTISSALAAWNALQEIMPDTSVEDFLAAMGSVGFNGVADIVKEKSPRGQKTKQANVFEDKLIEMGVLDQAPPSQYLAVQR